MSEKRHRGGKRGHGPRSMMVTDQPRDFKTSVKHLLRFLAPYRFALVLVFLCAIASTVFNVIGPKVLSVATTEVFNGSVAAMRGTGSINFSLVGTILLAALGLYAFSSLCALGQAWIMAGVSQRMCFTLR